MTTDFNALNREARARGERDFHRQIEANGPNGVFGSPVKVNPYEGNHATDEATEWADGWETAAAEHRLNTPVSHVALRG